MDSCRGCTHWGFREMISKSYGYVGDIPCLRCKRFNEPQDLYQPKIEPTDLTQPQKGA